MTPQWPLQSECPAFYGNPTDVKNGTPMASAKWQAANLVSVPLPWHAVASWDAKLPITSVRVHQKVQASFARILNALWDRAKAINPQNPQAEIDRVGLSRYGGSYMWRPSRTGHMLSMHAYGCAVDFDPARNGLGDHHPFFGKPENRWVVDAFAAEGWVWGGQWSNPDGMHFQAARVA
jgi:hypothetical protein